MWFHPKPSEIRRFCLKSLPIHAKEIRPPDSSARSALTRDLSSLQFSEAQNGCLHHVLIEVIFFQEYPFLTKIEASSDRSRESPDTSCSSVAVGSCHTGGPFFSALVQLKVVLEEPTVENLRHQHVGHAFPQQVPSLMLAA